MFFRQLGTTSLGIEKCFAIDENDNHEKPLSFAFIIGCNKKKNVTSYPVKEISMTKQFIQIIYILLLFTDINIHF